MREILFRGRRADNGEWIEGVPYGEYMICGMSLLRADDEIPMSEYPEIDYVRIIPESKDQYTGLTDKNGKKIFEGDIIKAIWLHLGGTDTVVGSVVFIDASFVLDTKEHFLFFEDNIFVVDCEVIGNIHDNPELLKGDC